MRVEALIAWAVGSGAYIEPIEIRVADDGNRSVFARRPIAKDEVLVTVPRKLMIGHEDAASSAVGAPMQSFASMLHSRYMTLAVWLAAERVIDETRWRPYVD